MPRPSWFTNPSWDHSARSMLRRAGPHRPAKTKAFRTAAAPASPVQAGAASLAAPLDAFGSLVDLARLQIGSPSAEICDACNTINIGSARSCKCCAHRLPAFYTAWEGVKKAPPRVLLLESLGLSARASVIDFAAFSVVINLLMVITASIPVR
jgi:hypothetical protein